MPVADVRGYLERVPCYGQVSQRFLGQAPADMATWMIEDLVRAGAVRIDGATLRPLIAA